MSTTETCSAGAELVGDLTSSRDPVSSGEEFGEELGSERKKPPGLTPSPDEIGDKLPLGVFVSVRPNVSEPMADSTEVEDWFSCSETDKFGDAELLCCSSTRDPVLRGATSLRG